MTLLKHACKPIAPDPLLLSSELQNHAREPIKRGETFTAQKPILIVDLCPAPFRPVWGALA